MDTLEIKGITKVYGANKALDDVSFRVNKGQIVGLLGPNGAGKTTTMSIITGILAADAGEVLFDGQKMTAMNEIDIKSKIGFLSEANPLYRDMLVSEYLDHMAGLRGLTKGERKQAIARVVKETGIEDRLHQQIEELSKGYKQRVGLAQAILHQPELLILDEPTEGLDPNQRVTIRDLIADLGKERTVMISTHVLSEVQATCDHVIILNKGKLVSQGTVEEVMTQTKGGQRISFEAKGESISEKLRESGLQVTDKRELEGRQAFRVLGSSEQDLRPKLFEIAKQQGWTVYELHEESMSLEDTFRQLTLDQPAAEQIDTDSSDT
jgi:ABC-2 type transport system ATP-binding protein